MYCANLVTSCCVIKNVPLQAHAASNKTCLLIRESNIDPLDRCDKPHILLRQSPLCDLHEDRSPSTDDVEVFCNEIAGNILVPASALKRELNALGLGSAKPAESEIENLSRRFSVSREVVVRRLLTTGRVSLNFYQSKRDQ
jgi:IrrE N-terminal-like domain